MTLASVQRDKSTSSPAGEGRGRGGGKGRGGEGKGGEGWGRGGVRSKEVSGYILLIINTIPTKEIQNPPPNVWVSTKQ